MVVDCLRLQLKEKKGKHFKISKMFCFRQTISPPTIEGIVYNKKNVEFPAVKYGRVHVQ